MFWDDHGENLVGEADIREFYMGLTVLGETRATEVSNTTGEGITGWVDGCLWGYPELR